MSETGLTRKLWTYWKRGRSEIAIAISIYTMYLIKPTTIFETILLLLGVGIGGLILGYGLIKKVDTTNPYVNPFQQDGVLTSIYFYEGLIDYFDGRKLEAINKMHKALYLRHKWMDRK